MAAQRLESDTAFFPSISVHLLLHLRDFILAHGSCRISSQACCEREIGLLKSKLRSYRAPYQNLSNELLKNELAKAVDFLLPSTASTQLEDDTTSSQIGALSEETISTLPQAANAIQLGLSPSDLRQARSYASAQTSAGVAIRSRSAPSSSQSRQSYIVHVSSKAFSRIRVPEADMRSYLQGDRRGRGRHFRTGGTLHQNPWQPHPGACLALRPPDHHIRHY